MQRAVMYARAMQGKGSSLNDDDWKHFVDLLRTRPPAPVGNGMDDVTWSMVGVFVQAEPGNKRLSSPRSREED